MVRARLANQKRGTFGEWGLLVFLGVASLLLFTPRLYGADEIKYFAPLRSLYFDQSAVDLFFGPDGRPALDVE